MYRIQRDQNRITIEDWNGKVIYSVSEDAWIVYRTRAGVLDVEVAQVKTLTDKQLLTALANAVSLAIAPGQSGQ